MITDGQHGKLFYIQDCDRPMYIVAGSWSEAVYSWKTIVAVENDDEIEETSEPAGVSLIADEDEWASAVAVVQIKDRIAP